MEQGELIKGEHSAHSAQKTQKCDSVSSLNFKRRKDTTDNGPQKGIFYIDRTGDVAQGESTTFAR